MSTATAPAATPKPRTKPVKSAAPAPAAKPVDDARTLQRAANSFRQLGDTTRLRVLLLLTEGELNVGELCARNGMKQPALSHHIALCRHSGLVEPRRNGKNVYYGLTESGSRLAAAAKALIETQGTQ